MAATVSSIIPELWAAMFTMKLRENLVWGMRVNTMYEGQLMGGPGDEIHIPTDSTSITISDYTPGTALSAPAEATTSATQLEIDKKKATSFKVDSVDEIQTAPDLMMEVMAEAAWKMADQIDDDIMTEVNTARDSGREESVTEALSAAAWPVKFAQALTATGLEMSKVFIPEGDRWAVIHPAHVKAITDSLMLSTSTSLGGVFTPAVQEQAFRNGFMGRMVGFDLYVSTKVPDGNTSASDFRVFCGQGNGAVTHAQQLAVIDAHRMEAEFADRINMLTLYGTKVIHADRLFTINTKKE